LETATKRLYEGMFLVDSAQAAADWDGTLAVIETILKRADADVVSMRKWGERRLAYEINHQTRGTYILCYFKANGQRIAGIEKDVQLSEKVMRVLILGTEKRPAKMLEADIAGVSAEAGSRGRSSRKAGGACGRGRSGKRRRDTGSGNCGLRACPDARNTGVRRAGDPGRNAGVRATGNRGSRIGRAGEALKYRSANGQKHKGAGRRHRGAVVRCALVSVA